MNGIGFNKIILPRYVYTGPNVIKELPLIFHHLALSKGNILLISGKGETASISNDSVKPLLESEGIEAETMEIESMRNFVDNLPEMIHKVKDSDPKIILGVGGGKAIDSAKLLASITNKRLISVPTNASHDGLSSPVISFVLNLYLRKKFDLKMELKAPVAIVADINFIKNCPKKSLVAGVGDLLAKKTAVKDWELAYMLRNEEYSEYAASMALMSARLIEDNINEIAKFDERSISIILKALIGSGIGISVAGSSRPASGSEHLFSHALDILSEEYGFKAELHGIQVGIGTIVMSQLHGLNHKKIRDLLKKVGAATNAKELGIDREYLIKALMMSNKIRRDRYTILGDADISYNAAEKLLKRAEVI
ncbi:MAG TPA: sn-glycerol-1-phosphate dehydrogenase [Geobacterales bacterium]|nr:sn-glycerol-1-phosphate dehydrogenase [Geobacterales bacterium]